MDSKTDTPAEKDPEKSQGRDRLLTRFLKWLTRGTEKAARNGNICST